MSSPDPEHLRASAPSLFAVASTSHAVPGFAAAVPVRAPWLRPKYSQDWELPHRPPCDRERRARGLSCSAIPAPESLQIVSAAARSRPAGQDISRSFGSMQSRSELELSKRSRRKLLPAPRSGQYCFLRNLPGPRLQSRPRGSLWSRDSRKRWSPSPKPDHRRSRHRGGPTAAWLLERSLVRHSDESSYPSTPATLKDQRVLPSRPETRRAVAPPRSIPWRYESRL